MKKTLLALTILGLVFYSNFNFGQESEKAPKEETTVEESDTAVQETTKDDVKEAEEIQNIVAADDEEIFTPKGTQVIMQKFIEGGKFMFPVLLTLILGLAICIEKILTLNFKSINSGKFLTKIESLLKNNDVEGAQELCRNTRGAISSIFYQAFLRRSGGIAEVEKSIVSYGSVQMGLLEKGLVWVSLFIAIAPMLGFMGTVVGMIQAFDQIEIHGDISPSLVAGGIKVALLTTVAGLIVAVVLQLFYNYLISKVDSIVNDMEDSSISLVDMMLEYDVANK